MVVDSFHTRPLLRIVQSADRYQVLGLNRHEVRLFEGNRDSFDEIELAPQVPRTLTEAMDRGVERDRATRAHGPIKPQTMGRHGASDVKQDGVRSDTEHFSRVVVRLESVLRVLNWLMRQEPDAVQGPESLFACAK